MLEPQQFRYFLAGTDPLPTPSVVFKRELKSWGKYALSVPVLMFVLPTYAGLFPLIAMISLVLPFTATYKAWRYHREKAAWLAYQAEERDREWAAIQERARANREAREKATLSD